MSRDSYYIQKFKCKGCKKSVSQYTWLSEIDKCKCDICSTLLKPIFDKVESAPSVIIASKHSKGRSITERNKRRSDDFIKNTLPTLSKSDKRYFLNKFKKKINNFFLLIIS